VRIVDEDLNPWEEAAVATSTLEVVGWSTDERDLFHMQGRFPVPPGKGFSGSAEVWFRPFDGGEARRIGGFLAKVPSR